MTVKHLAELVQLSDRMVCRLLGTQLTDPEDPRFGAFIPRGYHTDTREVGGRSLLLCGGTLEVTGPSGDVITVSPTLRNTAACAARKWAALSPRAISTSRCT